MLVLLVLLLVPPRMPVAPPPRMPVGPPPPLPPPLTCPPRGLPRAPPRPLRPRSVGPRPRPPPRLPPPLPTRPVLRAEYPPEAPDDDNTRLRWLSEGVRWRARRFMGGREEGRRRGARCGRNWCVLFEQYPGATADEIAITNSNNRHHRTASGLKSRLPKPGRPTLSLLDGGPQVPPRRPQAEAGWR